MHAEGRLYGAAALQLGRWYFHSCIMGQGPSSSAAHSSALRSFLGSASILSPASQQPTQQPRNVLNTPWNASAAYSCPAKLSAAAGLAMLAAGAGR